MSEYNFSKLNDKEFESLSIDLISILEGARIERFKQGKDSGVDGRFFSPSGSEVVIQCKHWLKSGLPALMRELKSSEADKVRKLKPVKYIFITSLELSRHNKKTIKNIFSPYIKSESDIFGNEDLNDLLSKHKEIEEKHYKLWLSSANVLRTIFNAAVVGRSTFKLEEVNDFSAKYVRTKVHNQALDKLDKLRSIIITGEPGIGKTTLADHLCLHYVIKGYELCYIEESISEAENLITKDKKQIFYFDDFLGRNYLSALNRHEDSHIIYFIRRIGKAKGKRFILTSRSTILNQGKRLSDLFNIENIDRNEYELTISQLSALDKAKILYNHIWFGDLNEKYVDELYIDKRYKQVIYHANFNPRLVSFVTDAHKIADVEPKKYWQYIEQTLEDPSDIWGHVYDNQLNVHGQYLACIVSFNGREINEENLKNAFLHIANRSETKFGYSDFVASAKLATGAVINRTISKKDNSITYDLFNPALGDFLLHRYAKDEDAIYLFFESLDTDESLNNLNSLFNEHAIDIDVAKNVLSRLLDYCLISVHDEKTVDYTINVIDLALGHIFLTSTQKKSVINWLCKFEQDSSEIYQINAFFQSLNKLLNSGIAEANDLPLCAFVKSMLTEDLYHDDYVSISKVIYYLDDICKKWSQSKLREFVINYWVEMIDEDIGNEDVLGEYHYDEEEDEAEKAVIKHINKLLGEYSITFNENDVSQIYRGCDVWSHIENNRENASMPDDQDDHRSHGSTDYTTVNEATAIDNLFQRT